MATRLQREQAFHDEQARERAAHFGAGPEALRFDDDDYLDHESWVRPAFAALGDVAGRRVLDLGCGHGMAAVMLARRGANVVGCDLSAGYLAEARRRAQANGTTVAWVKTDGQRLPFADAAFDAVWGHAVLHHLDMASAAAELRRVLRPGGRAVFCEPWGENPLLHFARRHLPYRGKGHTADEKPLGRQDVRVLKQFFPRLEMTGHQLLSMARRVLGMGRRLEQWDRRLLGWFPSLRRYCRYVVLVLPT